MFRRALDRDALWMGEMRAVEVRGTQVLLVDVDGEVSAFEDRCAHKAYPLSRGRLDGSVLTCAAHEWQFDARTGAGVNPRGVTLRRLPVELRAGGIWVDVDPTEADHG